MPLVRFQFIKTRFHIENYSELNKLDPLHEFRYFVEYLYEKFQTHYYPEQDLCIDETMIPCLSKKSKTVCRNKLGCWLEIKSIAFCKFF